MSAADQPPNPFTEHFQDASQKSRRTSESPAAPSIRRVVDDDDDDDEHEESGPRIFGRFWLIAIALSVSIGAMLVGVAVQVIFTQRNIFAKIPDWLEFHINADPFARVDADIQGRDLLTRANKATKQHKRPECDWVNGTDMQAVATALPVTVAVHILMANILIVMVAAEVQRWRRKLHASAGMNIGLLQVWIGLDVLSRSLDMVSLVNGYMLLTIGVFNISIGGICRFQEDGPGFALFGTGKCNASRPAQLQRPRIKIPKIVVDDVEKQQPKVEAAPTVTSAATPTSLHTTVGPPPPTPMYQQPMPFYQQPTLYPGPYPSAYPSTYASPMPYVPPSVAIASGYEVPPMAPQSPHPMSLMSGAMYGQFLTPGPLSPGLATPLTATLHRDDDPKPAPAHLLTNPFQPGTQKPEIKGSGLKFWKRSSA